MVRAGRRERGGLEHETLAVLALNGAAMTPAEVRDALDQDLAYTTVMTVLSRLHAKQRVTRHRAGRGFAYVAIVDDAEVTARQMQRLLDARDDRAAVLSRFVGALSDDDERLLTELLAHTDPPGPRTENR
jgi:predicted transcriptional regulator